MVKKNFGFNKILAYIFLVSLMVVWIVPLFFGIFTSFKSDTEIANIGFRLLPINWTLSQYIDIFLGSTSTPIVRWFLNSLVISTLHTFFALLIVSLAAYGYTRLEFPGNNKIFWLLMCASMFPSVVNIIPQYKIVDTFGWLNTIWAVIVPGLGGVTNIFLVRQFMLGIPKEYDESAKIDGASDFCIYSKIIVPLIRPVLTVVALFSFTGSWNDFLWPTIVFTDIKKMPITAGLQFLRGQYGGFQYIGQLMASATFAIIPTFIIFLFAQKYFMESLSLSSGVKG
ncbi:MAG: carbohydrate ABC transporter permease [Lachnospirales bacterium]